MSVFAIKDATRVGVSLVLFDRSQFNKPQPLSKIVPDIAHANCSCREGGNNPICLQW